MRVTKIIKAYVEKEVSAIYDSKIADIRKPYDDEKTKAEKLIAEITLRANEEIAQALKVSGFEPWSSYKDYVESSTIINREKWDKVEEKISKLRKEKNEKIDDILINLELGSVTKEELDNIIMGLGCNDD